MVNAPSCLWILSLWYQPLPELSRNSVALRIVIGVMFQIILNEIDVVFHFPSLPHFIPRMICQTPIQCIVSHWEYLLLGRAVVSY